MAKLGKLSLIVFWNTLTRAETQKYKKRIKTKRKRKRKKKKKKNEKKELHESRRKEMELAIYS